MKFKPGDRVKLTNQVALSIMRERKHWRSQRDWLKREGTVVSYAKVADSVSIKWDDRRTLDFWPHRALEKV